MFKELKSKSVKMILLVAMLIPFSVIASQDIANKIIPIIFLILDEEVTPSIDLSSAELVRHSSPVLGSLIESKLFSDETGEQISGFECALETKPTLSLSTISVETDGTIIFEADEEGEYSVVCEADGTSIQFSYFLTLTLPFTQEKLSNYDPTIPLKEQSGLVINQFWIESLSLSDTQIETIIDDDLNLSLVGKSLQFGHLVEIDETSIVALESIESLKLTLEIDSLIQRYFEGQNSQDRVEYDLPNDLGSLDDGGENWHLEKINIVDAWNIQTGNGVKIGIIEQCINRVHEDISLAENPSAADCFTPLTNSDHGNSVVSTIGAKTNNGKGIAGIIHDAKLVGLETGDGDGGIKRVYEERSKADAFRVINYSGGKRQCASYIPNEDCRTDEFNPNNSKQANDAFNEMSLIASVYRDKYFSKVPDSLFVLAAGNGVGQGDPANSDETGYGFDAMYSNGNFHYGSNLYDEVENLLVVGALEEDGLMSATSNYGISVDIVAPTKFKAATGDGYISSFSGTSASAPVVTGVAGLIYSINPEFSGQEVKDILVESANEFVTHRYSSQTFLGDNTDPEALDHPIPILNAKAALELADFITNGASAEIEIESVDATSNMLTFVLDIKNTSLVMMSYALSLEGYNNGVWELISDSITQASGNMIQLPLSGYYKYRLSGNVLVEHPSSGQSSISVENNFHVNQLNISVFDAISKESVGETLITLEPNHSPYQSWAGILTQHLLTTDSNGQITAYMLPSTYKVLASKSAFSSSQSQVSAVSSDNSLSIDLYINSSSDLSIGSLSGIVTNLNGEPIVGAKIDVVGNGVTTSATSDVSGHYKVIDIPKLVNNEYVESFIVKASSLGYLTSQFEGILILKITDGESTHNVTLLEGEEEVPYSPLNDTGIVVGGNYPSGNNTSCDGESIAQQDCSHGRDMTHNDNSDGYAGFSFTKISDSGEELPASATDWSCVTDNVTGLIWEKKTNDAENSDAGLTFRWGGLSAQGRNYPDLDEEFGAYYDDWNELVNYLNANNLCGFTDWRVPTIQELTTIRNLAVINPSIDTNYFPNTRPSKYWSSSPSSSAFYSGISALAVDFSNGTESSFNNRTSEYHVRLVR